MAISIPATLTIEDDALSVLLAAAFQRLPDSAVLASTLSPSAGERELNVELPEAWREVERRMNESYTWPQGEERYDPFVVYEGMTSRGSIRLAIGRCRRVRVWGKDRIYLITFHVTDSGKQPLCEFLETDDYATTREMVAIIRGTGVSQRGMYDPSMALPGAYRKLKTAVYRDRIRVDRSWNRQAVVAREDDVETMLAHSLIQAEHRFGIRPR